MTRIEEYIMSDPWVENTQQWINTTYPGTLGIAPLVVDGQTGWNTIYALIRALQHELGITALSNNFGSGTLAALTAVSPVNNSTTNKNIIRIAQGAMYCKGYNGGNGALDGVWDATPIAGMQSLRTNMGLSAGDGSIEPKVFKALLNMDAFTLVSGGTSTIRSIQQSLNGRYLGRSAFFVIPTDGRYTTDIQTALMYAIQYEVGLVDGVANGNFGPATKSGLATYGALSYGSTDSTRYLVHLFQAALIFNGYTVAYDGYFGNMTQLQTEAFQGFVALPVNGSANVQTWGSLLVSTGDADRPGTGADCVTTITSDRLAALQTAGYNYFGRYLTNTPDTRLPSSGLDKCIKAGELQRIFNAGGHAFILFQTGGGDIAHFTTARGQEVGEEAGSAAWAYRLPANTIIYFSVDFDATDSQIMSAIIPYFQALPERLNRMGRTFRIGVYGPRKVCHALTNASLVVSSFVSDMSTGYGSNRAVTLPSNWAFDQIQTKYVGSGFGTIEIDKNIVSGAYSGISSLTSAWGVGDDPAIPAGDYTDMWNEMFRDTFEHEGLIQQGFNLDNAYTVKTRVWEYDDYITDLAAQFNAPKAMILTPMVHEGLCVNPFDTAADLATMSYYQSMELGIGTFPDPSDDCSTGFCQIQSQAAISGINYAINMGLITGSILDRNVWQDRWSVWWQLYSDGEFNLRATLFYMMYEAYRAYGITQSELRSMTPSQVMGMCVGYNGTGEEAMRYGRNRMSQYFTIQRWEESFR